MVTYFFLLTILFKVTPAALDQSDDVYLAVKRVTEDAQVTQGRPGKRGAIGAPGPIGPVGPKGEVGECICDVSVSNQPKRHMRTLTNQLQASAQESKRRIASLTEQLNSIPRERLLPEEGWYTPWNGYQYYVSFTTQSWWRSRSLCRGKGGNLAAVGMRNLHTRNHEEVRIGLSDMANEGTFLWLDGVPSTSNNTHWHADNPNNYNVQDRGQRRRDELSNQRSKMLGQPESFV